MAKKMKKFTHESGRKYVNILNIHVNSTSKEQVLAFVRDSLARGYQFRITTPNPEIILAAQNDADLANALNTSDLAIPDGVGLRYAAKFLTGEDLAVLPGRIIFWELISLANKKGWRIFLFGGAPGVAGKAAKNLGQSFSSIKVHFAAGPKYDNRGNPVTKDDERIHQECLTQINAFKPQLLFIALGAPKQEKWLTKNLAKLKAGGGMAVGGSLDYLAGRANLPPKWMEKLELEWLWRLLRQPFRLARIVKAVIIFPWLVFLRKLTRKNDK